MMDQKNVQVSNIFVLWWILIYNGLVGLYDQENHPKIRSAWGIWIDCYTVENQSQPSMFGINVRIVTVSMLGLLNVLAAIGTDFC